MKARPDPGAIYTSLVEGSPSIALEGLKEGDQDAAIGTGGPSGTREGGS